MTDEAPTSFIEEHLPKKEEVLYSIGPYQILRSIGKGGMGEVWLAYDTKTGRRVALKQIRQDLLQHKILHNRFLKEAKITSQLPHPAIMPIYSIEDNKEFVYYTMPFVQGETLKQILRTTREQEKQGTELHHIGGSIPSLIRIFIAVCQGVAFAHTKGVLHRDLKPENVMIGKYGEILILDWGLAKLFKTEDPSDEELPFKTASGLHELTRPGKVVGTVSFMAPERAFGGPSTIQTEIYALGVTLYQILTLRNPFHRKSLEEFREKLNEEALLDPATLAPYRDVPPILSRIAMKCLSKNPIDRYANVYELLTELENYVEGRSEWFQIAKLDIHKKEDWEFQEHVLLREHIAITRDTETTDWVNLMVTKASFSENSKVKLRLSIGEKGYGIGILLSLPEAAERTHLSDGYCLWLGSDINKSTKLLRSTVEVINAPEIFLNRGQSYDVEIEKIDHNLYFYLNGTLQFSYISHLPLLGTHFGLLSRDGDFTIEEFLLYVGSQNITVNCLSVPDALLAHKNYAAALHEYRRIGYSFPGRAEGREAMFRAGITILEEARTVTTLQKKELLYEDALEEFAKLHNTPGAPLEYLGKAHVYQAMQDLEEEVKCYELGLRKYPKHPLLPVLHEKLIYRLHEISRTHRKATYLFMLAALSHLPDATESLYTKKLFESLQKHWEPLFFIEQEPVLSEKVKQQSLRVQLSFWLAKPAALAEIINELLEMQPVSEITLANALFCLIELGDIKMARKKLEKLPPNLKSHASIQSLDFAILCHEEALLSAAKGFFQNPPNIFCKSEIRLLIHLIEESLQKECWSTISYIQERLSLYEHLKKEELQRFHSLFIEKHLLCNDWQAAADILQLYPLTLLTQDRSLFFVPYGCWLGATEGGEIAAVHFSGVLDASNPSTSSLLAHFLNGKISIEGRWGKEAFLWEKRQLFRQLKLFYHCIGNDELENHYNALSLT